MPAPIIATKLYVPPSQPTAIRRPHLVARLNEGVHRKLTVISAAAGFGKSTLLSDWVANSERPAGWLSLDEADSDPARFLTYLVAALQTVSPDIGSGIVEALQSPQPPPTESILTALLNDIAAVPREFVLVLDDYHVVDSRAVNDAMLFLLDHLPPHMHLVIATREDPQLPLSRLRARGQLNELRAADLRFSHAEAAEFLNQAMGLNLTSEDIAALESRTEGWIAGLQLAAISMRGHEDATGFIRSFSGSHRFVLDYLMEEVLNQQTEHVQSFLLSTSILDRMCGSLCDAVLLDSSSSGQETLEHLERANLFIVSLDNERRWFRYHHLFGELLRQRLQQDAGPQDVDEVHRRASRWFEAQGLEIEAFQHAAAGHDVAGAERLIEGQGSPLFVRGGAVPVLNWLESLPPATLNARPWLWVTYATVLSIIGKISRVEQQLQAAEAVLDTLDSADMRAYLLSRIEDLRELLGILTADPRQLDATIAKSSALLEVPAIASEDAPASTLWKLGLAYQLKGNRRAAGEALRRSIAVSRATGNVHVDILATTVLGRNCEYDNDLVQAAGYYRHVLHLAGTPPGPIACEAYAGLARISCEWNDLQSANEYGLLSLQLARQVEIASFVASELALARVQLARGDVPGAVATLAALAAAAQQERFRFRLPEIAAAQVLAFIRMGDLSSAEALVQTYDLPLSRARVLLARGDASAALALLGPYRRRAEAAEWGDEQLKTAVLHALAQDGLGDRDAARLSLNEALALAEPGGFVRTFLDEGPPMAALLAGAAARGIMPDYTARLLVAFDAEGHAVEVKASPPAARPAQTLVDPLSERELEVLRLIAHGLSNAQIGERLFLALSTVKGHNRNIFGKLQVERRTEAIARARELGLI